LGNRIQVNHFQTIFNGTSYKEDYKTLKQLLKPYNLTVPILYKHYTDLCELDGIKYLDFGVDSGFENCIDGLILIEIAKIKEEKKEKFINYFLRDEKKPT